MSESEWGRDLAREEREAWCCVGVQPDVGGHGQVLVRCSGGNAVVTVMGSSERDTATQRPTFAPVRSSLL